MKGSISSACRSAALVASMAAMALAASAAQANSLQKQNFLNLMTHADSIVVGTVTEKTDGFQNGLPYTEITLHVGQNIKGDHGSNYTFRQFGLIKPKSMGDGRVNLMVTPAGWPTYAKGEEVMLFLHKPASETGFQTTAGLTQGKFTIRGQRVANPIGNESLFEGVKINRALPPGQQKLVNQHSGSYSTQDFLTLVKTAVDENWIENGVMTNEK